jgi:hypothetical protein
MESVSTDLRNRARRLFEELGYSIDETPAGFRAERKWRTVSVQTVSADAPLPSDGQLRCFVTTADDAEVLRSRLLDARPDYDWAIIAVAGEDYEVYRGRDEAGSVKPA